ncbi:MULTISPECIES: PAS domain-containing protein [Roseomonadaceae]|uniref:PAS-domain containing protein n=1 Tax=Falsiroseomonas oleicola TaxID=2801474 RepID=A0ABS6HCH7_9PROT|nr:PAS-domain containing protein [Roseomonas oleicola]MBU8545020.1 PAS-domain containing protein [Roseomonas oleicola]
MLALPLWLAALSLMPRPALAQAVALWPTASWMAGGLLALLCALGLLVVLRMAHQLREMRREAAALAAGNVDLRLLAERAETKARQLDAAIAAMSDGFMATDSDLRLVGWNSRFADYAGLPRHGLRIGMPMEEVLRLQAEAGEFGLVDPDAEAARRIAVLRDGPLLERWVRRRPDGSRLELRRAPLPGGGYVTLYTPLAEDRADRSIDSLAEAFRQEWADRMPRLVAAATRGDAPAARDLAHALRGIAANAGWPAAADLLAQVEAVALAGDAPELRRLTCKLPVEAPRST